MYINLKAEIGVSTSSVYVAIATRIMADWLTKTKQVIDRESSTSLAPFGLFYGHGHSGIAPYMGKSKLLA